MGTGGDLQACGDGEGGPINDGFFADVLNGGNVGDAEAGGTGGVLRSGRRTRRFGERLLSLRCCPYLESSSGPSAH